MYPEAFDEKPNGSYYNIYNGYTYCNGHELDNMSGKEVYLWQDTVLCFCTQKRADRDRWYLSANSGLEHIKYSLKAYYNEISNEEIQVVRDAYHALADWEWDYYNSTGSLYNFIENKDSLDYIHEHYGTDSEETGSSSSEIEETTDSQTDEVSEITSEESEQSVITEVYSAMPEPTSSYYAASYPTDSGVNNKTGGAGKTIVLVIVIAAVIGAVGFFAYRKGQSNAGGNK